MTNDTDTPTNWRIEQAESEKQELVQSGALSPENLRSFMVYRFVSLSMESFERQDKVSLEGTLTCACGYEIPLNVTIGFKGFLDAPSKHLKTCPQCHRGMMLVGETTGADASEKQWLLVTPTTGKPSVVEMPGTVSGLPELNIETIERIVDESEELKKWEVTRGVKPQSEEKPTATSEQPDDQIDIRQEIEPDLVQARIEPITLSGSSLNIWHMAISPDSNYFISTDLLELKIWDTKTGKERATLIGHTSPILSCAISPDATFIVTASGVLIGSGDSTLKIWDVATGKERVTLKGHKEFVQSCAISPDSHFVVSASGDRTLKIWDVSTGEERATLKGHSKSVQGCAISSDSSLIISRSADMTLKIWDVRTGRAKATLKGHTEHITGCAFSSDSSFFVSASWDKTLKIWDSTSGKERATLKGHTDRVNDFAISSDNSFIVSSSNDKTLKIWDAATGEERATISGHAGAVNACAISPDSTLIVSGSSDKTIKIWSATTGKEIAMLTGQTKPIVKCFISPDSSHIVSQVGLDTLKIWSLPSELNRSRDPVSVHPDETIEQPPVEEKTESPDDDMLPSEVIEELFNRRCLDPKGKKILAFAILYERDMAPSVWVGPGPDPYAVKSESAETRQLRFLASKILPGYQPHFIPGHLKIGPETVVTGRKFEQGESLDVGYINQVLAVMLSDLLEDQDLLDDQELRNCSALSLSGNSVATGEARFALVVK